MRHMNNPIKTLALISFSGALLACTPNVSEVKTDIPQERFMAKRGLPAQKLKSGACAMFLWGAGHGRPLQFYQDASVGNARLAINPATLAKRERSEQQIVEGFYANQMFRQGDLQITVTVKPAPSRNVLKGIPIPTGRMVVKEANGRETIIPVAGLFGCRN